MAVAVGVATGPAVGSLSVVDGVSATVTVGTAMTGVGLLTVGVMASAEELHATNRATNANTEAKCGRLARLN